MAARPAKADSTFVLDQGGKVSHFNYFSNAQTASAVVNALTKSESPDGFSVIGPLSWAGKSSTGVRAALPSRTAGQGSRTACALHPAGNTRQQPESRRRTHLAGLAPRQRLRTARLRCKENADIVPDGPIGIYYDDLATSLFSDHDVKPFAFDWRRPIKDEAKRLATEIAAALDARETIKAAGTDHRTLHGRSGCTGDADLRTRHLGPDDEIRRSAHPDAGNAERRILGAHAGALGRRHIRQSPDQCGSPVQRQCHAPVDCQLPGIRPAPGRSAGRIGRRKDLEGSRGIRSQSDAARTASGTFCRFSSHQFEWGIPPQAVLDEAVAFRRALDKQRDKDLAAFADKLLLVVGKAASTPAGYERSDKDDGGVVYLDAPGEGDGRVTLENAELPGVATWVVNADHGSLPRHRAAFEGYRELLNSGKTEQLRQLGHHRHRTGSGTGATPDRWCEAARRDCRRRNCRHRRELDVLAPAARAPPHRRHRRRRPCASPSSTAISPTSQSQC